MLAVASDAKFRVGVPKSLMQIKGRPGRAPSSTRTPLAVKGKRRPLTALRRLLKAQLWSAGADCAPAIANRNPTPGQMPVCGRGLALSPSAARGTPEGLTASGGGRHAGGGRGSWRARRWADPGAPVGRRRRGVARARRLAAFLALRGRASPGTAGPPEVD